MKFKTQNPRLRRPACAGRSFGGQAKLPPSSRLPPTPRLWRTSRRAGKARNGQVILLSVMIMGGIMIGAAAIGSLLLIYQIRTVNDAVNSAKAIFAADTGIELVTWCAFKGCNPNDADDPPSLVFEDNSVSFKTSYKATGSTQTIGSQGFSGNAVRILKSVFIYE